jgi:7-cyano-7-deazaguanine synthase
MTKALVVLSGGQDSTTCLYAAARRFTKVSAITFDYGQRHKVELQAAARVWALVQRDHPQTEYGEHVTLTVGDILKSTSPLVSTAALEQYPDYHSLPGGLEKTFVPMRNMLFLTLAANHAIHCGAGSLVTGVCQEDFGGYPDCRRDFIDALEIAINESLGIKGVISIETPLMYMTKAASVVSAARMGAYTALAFSHTSYDGQYPPVGHDHATLLRAKGFDEAGFPDPLVVRAVMEGLMDWSVLGDNPIPENVVEDIAKAGAYLAQRGL